MKKWDQQRNIRDSSTTRLPKTKKKIKGERNRVTNPMQRLVKLNG
jgi:hypothetical protein